MADVNWIRNNEWNTGNGVLLVISKESSVGMGMQQKLLINSCRQPSCSDPTPAYCGATPHSAIGPHALRLVAFCLVSLLGNPQVQFKLSHQSSRASGETL